MLQTLSIYLYRFPLDSGNNSCGSQVLAPIKPQTRSDLDTPNSRERVVGDTSFNDVASLGVLARVSEGLSVGEEEVLCAKAACVDEMKELHCGSIAPCSGQWTSNDSVLPAPLIHVQRSCFMWM